MPNTSAQIIIGKVGSTFGIHGWLKIRAYTEFGDTILKYQPWYLSLGNNAPTEYKVEEGKINSKGLIVKLSGINSPEEGRLLTGSTISIDRSLLPPLAKNEYYWSDLIGLTVLNKVGERLGTVIYLMATGSNDVLVVKGTKEFAVPYIFDKVILKIDLEKQEIHVDWEPL